MGLDETRRGRGPAPGDQVLAAPLFVQARLPCIVAHPAGPHDVASGFRDGVSRTRHKVPVVPRGMF